LASGLPSIYADPSQLEQIIHELVVNAGDAMPEGGGCLLDTGYQYSKTLTSSAIRIATGSYVTCRCPIRARMEAA